MLLWQRAIGDPEFRRIFCLVHAERLTYQVSDKALRSLSDLSQGQRGDFMCYGIHDAYYQKYTNIVRDLHRSTKKSLLLIVIYINLQGNIYLLCMFTMF